MSRRSKLISVFALSTILLSVLALGMPRPAQAAEIRTGNPDAIVASDEVIDDDLFISGQNVRIEGTVNGDVFAAGSNVEVTGSIDGNLFVGSQFFTNGGTINGSVYSFSYVAVTGPQAFVADNTYAFAYSVSAQEGSYIGRTAYAFGYQGIFSGQIARDLNFFGSALRMDGSVDRNLKAEISQPRGAAYQPSPWMPGRVEALQPGYDVDRGTIGGETDIQVVQVPTPNAPRVEPRTLWGIAAAGWVINRIGDFIALFLVGALLFLAWPAPMARVENQMVKYPWRSLGLGFLAAILFPFVFILAVVVIILLAILIGLVSLGHLAGPLLTLGFLLLGLATATFFIAGLLAAKAISGHLVGSRLLQSSIEDKGWGLLLILAIGLLIYEVVQLVPILGWLVAALIAMAGLGAIGGAIWFKETKPAARKARR